MFLGLECLMCGSRRTIKHSKCKFPHEFPDDSACSNVMPDVVIRQVKRLEEKRKRIEAGIAERNLEVGSELFPLVAVEQHQGQCECWTLRHHDQTSRRMGMRNESHRTHLTSFP